MRLDALSKMNTGWLYEKGRFNWYHMDLATIDRPVLTAEDGTKFGWILPIPAFAKDLSTSYPEAKEYAERVRNYWLTNDVLYSSSDDAPSSTPSMNFYDISTNTYKPAHYEIRKVVYDPRYVDDPNHNGYAVCLFCCCDDGSGDEFVVQDIPFGCRAEYFAEIDPEYDVYLCGGPARNPVNGDLCIAVSFYMLYNPFRVDGQIFNVRCFPQWLYPIEHAQSLPSGVSDQNWGITVQPFSDEYRNPDHIGGGEYDTYDSYYYTYTPYGRRKYTKTQAPLHNMFSALVKAPSDMVHGRAFYNSSAGTTEPELLYNVDI